MNKNGVSDVAVIHDPTYQEVIVEFTSTHSIGCTKILINIDDLQNRMGIESIPNEVLLATAQLYNIELKRRGFKPINILH